MPLRPPLPPLGGGSSCPTGTLLPLPPPPQPASSVTPASASPAITRDKNTLIPPPLERARATPVLRHFATARSVTHFPWKSHAALTSEAACRAPLLPVIIH